MKLIPQEIFLLERYTSAAYFSELRDTWAEMIIHLVVPNFRDTLESLNMGYAALKCGDLDGLGHAHGPLNDLKGQSEYWSGWMTLDDENIYGALLNKAVLMAGNIVGERALLAPDTGLKYGNEPLYAERPCKWIMVEKIIA